MITTILFAAVTVAQTYGSAPVTSPAPATRVSSAASSAAPAPVINITPAAIPGRTLKDLAGTTITYYDIAGTTIPAIQLSLKTVHTDKNSARLYTWDVATNIQKITTGSKCTVQGATSALTATVRIPRLTEQASLAAPALAHWTAYVTKMENQAAVDLWFLSDRLRGAERALVGLPCDQAAPAWNAKLEVIRGELAARVAQRAAAAAAVPQATAAPK